MYKSTLPLLSSFFLSSSIVILHSSSSIALGSTIRGSTTNNGDTIHSNTDMDDNWGCTGITTVADCKCGSKPCNYCLKCPCYGCLSAKTFDHTKSQAYTSAATVTNGATVGNIGHILTMGGGSFVPAHLLDKEATLDPESCEISQDQCSMMLALHQLVNQHRQTLKLPLVLPNVILADVAQRHSCFMAETDQLGHSDTDKREFPASDKKLDDHVMRAGYQYGALGENVAAGQVTAKEVLQGWLKSIKHRATIETAIYTSLGLGLAASKQTGRLYWTQVFAKPRNPGIGGDGDLNQHESTTDVVGRYDVCHQYSAKKPTAGMDMESLKRDLEEADDSETVEDDVEPESGEIMD